MSGLNDAFHKLEQAKKHLTDFYRNINRTFDEKALRYNVESNPYSKPAGTKDPRPWNLYTIYIASIPVVSIEDSIIMGEAIQNFRSALDYFAWAWYLKSKTILTESQERRIYFPLASDSKSFNDQFNHKLPNFPDRTFIERYQPYQLTNTGLAMYYLRTLSDTDKHRIIVPTMMLPADGYAGMEFPKGSEVITTLERLELGQEMKEGTKILSVIVAGLDGKVKVDTDTVLAPAFPINLVRPRPPDEIVAVDPALNGIANTCIEILTEAVKYF